MDDILQLPSGAIARVRSLVVFRGKAESTLTIVIQAMNPATGDQHSAREAQELANLHDEFARRFAADRIAVSICRTEDCIAGKTAPETIFFFRRAADRSWLLDETVKPR